VPLYLAVLAAVQVAFWEPLALQYPAAWQVGIAEYRCKGIHSAALPMAVTVCIPPYCLARGCGSMQRWVPETLSILFCDLEPSVLQYLILFVIPFSSEGCEAPFKSLLPW